MYRLNLCSWVLLVIYLIVLITMEYFSPRFSFESIYYSVPLITAWILWSEKTTLIIKKSDSQSTIREQFSRDLFLISFSIISGYLVSLLLQYDNSDLLAWWPIVIYLISIFGLIYAFLFSLIATLLNHHKKYIYVCCFVVLLPSLFVSLMMHLNPLSIYAQDKTFYMIFLCLMGLHLFIALGTKIKQKLFP